MKALKKHTLSFLLVIIFCIYALHQKIGGSTIYIISNNSSNSSTSSLIDDTTSNPKANKPIPTQVKIPSTKTLPPQIPAKTTNNSGGMMGDGGAATSGFGMGGVMMALYKDGTYIGNVADAYYGNVQVKIDITGGKIADVIFLQYPNDRQTSVEINNQAMPYLKSEAIQAQNASVDGVSGATETSQAFIESLASALAQAKN